MRPIPRSLTLATLITLGCQAAEQTSPAPNFDLLPQKRSRYISIAPVDDGGKTSGRHAVTICLPTGYDVSIQRYAVVYILDGENAFQHRRMPMIQSMEIDVAHDQLVHENQIKPLIFVAIENSMDDKDGMLPGNRARDYLPMRPNKETGEIDQTKAEAYYQFIAQTIKPFIDKNFRTLPEPASTCVAGMSFSGIGAFWMTFSHPETFGLGLCQTPSFWSVKEYLEKNLDHHQGALPNVRLWLDAGSQELSQWLEGFEVYTKLLGLGFKANENVAFQTGHAHYHAPHDAAQRLRAALHFLFRNKVPQLTKAEIVDIDATTTGPIQLVRPARMALELVYNGWFRITDATTTFNIADKAIVAPGDAPNLMIPKTNGATTVSTTYKDAVITQTVTVAPSTAQFVCPRIDRPLKIDGTLSDWPELPYIVDRPQDSDQIANWKGKADCSYRFGCVYDDDFLYVGIETVDDHVVSVPGKDPWGQDGVEVRLDARPEPKRHFGRSEGEFSEILLVAICPTLIGETPARLPYGADKLPPGTKVVCVQTATGHNTEIAIPVTYLKSKCGAADWSSFRLNVDVNDRDNTTDTEINKFWWQPDWRSYANVLGSGTFSRK